jgi:copper resistance protein B
VITRAPLIVLCGALGLMAASFALAQESQDPSTHVAPEPPQYSMSDMPYKQMSAMMQMDDTAPTAKVLFDQLEWRNTAEGNAAVWDAEAWYGGDYNKIWLRSEGERVGATTQNARADVLWDHTFARWWSVQAGGREDFGAGPGRSWAAIGVQGLAPYWFDTEVTLYVGERGHTALRLKSEYELLVTQRLILQPEGEANLYGRADPARQLGSGLSDLQFGLRLRYEVRRELAPYIGAVWARQFGGDPSNVQFVAGIRAWL